MPLLIQITNEGKEEKKFSEIVYISYKVWNKGGMLTYDLNGPDSQRIQSWRLFFWHRICRKNHLMKDPRIHNLRTLYCTSILGQSTGEKGVKYW